MHDAAADQRAECVEFGREAGHPQRLNETAANELHHCVTADLRVLTGGQGARHDVRQDHAGCGTILELAARLRRKRPCLRIGGHIFRAAQEKHSDCIAVINRLAAFEMLQPRRHMRSEEHTSELQSLMRISYAVFCLKKTKQTTTNTIEKQQ